MKKKSDNFIKGSAILRIFKILVKTKKRKFLLLTLILFIGFITYRNATKPDWNLSTHTVRTTDLVESISASGDISATNYAELSFLAAEIIKEINVTDGEFVKKGQIIARQDTTNLYYALQAAEATLRNTAASLDSVYDDLKDKENSETFDEIATRTSAETTKDKAVFNHIIAQKNLAGATIRAPFDGIVSIKKGVSVGKYANTLTPSFVIVDPKTVFLESEVNELDIANIRSGTRVDVIVDAYPEETLQQEVLTAGFVSVTTSTGGTAYTVRVSLPENSDNKYRVGMNADLEFILATKENALTVPITAVVENGEDSYVWVIKNNRATKLIVETGISSIDETEIISGVNEGDLIISRPPTDIKERDVIKSL